MYYTHNFGMCFFSSHLEVVLNLKSVLKDDDFRSVQQVTHVHVFNYSGPLYNWYHRRQVSQIVQSFNTFNKPRKVYRVTLLMHISDILY